LEACNVGNWDVTGRGLYKEVIVGCCSQVMVCGYAAANIGNCK